MPRDGAGLYSTPPGTDGVPGFTVESARYNYNVHDVETDLNQPRPVIAGGTGGASASEALVNLGAEQAYQIITNYDSDVFSPGSFRSFSSAIGAPVAGHSFSGISYTTDNPPSPSTTAPPNDYLTIEARDASTGIRYARIKAAGTWGAWSVDGSGVFVKVAGDTMTGGLVLNSPDPLITMQKFSPAHEASIYSVSGLNSRWAMRFADAEPETGANAGSNFLITRFDDAGNYLGDPLIINRATGVVNIAQLQIAGSLYALGDSYANAFHSVTAPTSGIYYFGNGTSQYLQYDGTAFRLDGAPLVTSHYIWTNGNLHSVGHMSVDQGYCCQPGVLGGINVGDLFNFNWTGSSLQAYIGTTPVGVACDPRIKWAIEPLGHGALDAIRRMSPVSFSYRDISIFKDDGKRHIGFLADNLERVLPAAVIGSTTATTPDGQIQPASLDLLPLVAVLTKAVQELAGRVEALEAQRR
jgi:hypothetical protein